MSIPPLVCNTPPPPDQCEDDKEDFDLHYTLSQEDDDENGFDFQGFSGYSQFNSNVIEDKVQRIKCESLQFKEGGLPTTDGSEKEIEKLTDVSISTTTPQCPCEVTITEESNVEDLNLSVQEDYIPTASENETKNIKTCIVSPIDKEIRKINASKDFDTNNADDVNIVTSGLENISTEETSLNKDVTESTVSVNDADSLDIMHSRLNADCDSFYENLNINVNCPITAVDCEEEIKAGAPERDNDDDDFGDFEDFKVSSTSFTPAIAINSCDNPWEGSVVEQDSNFSDFKASFDSASNEISKDSKTKPLENNIKDDDEFGDFDEFKSSNTTGETVCNENDSCHEAPPNQMEMLNLQASGSGKNLIENINKVLSTIFESEIPNDETVLEGDLDSSLGETWRHLLDTDERQPYMVPWNNSSGQKTLLKSLCIDSRNILFAPKWNSNMPKFAANLSNAPLQPQKQSTSSSVTSNETSVENLAGKSTISWTDPFTSDGQESCSSDKNINTTEVRHTELEMFAKNTEKIFSTTPNVQPIRQINLPDTHIFTPTDSETPRSKTIHYGSGPQILIPQTTNSQSSNADVPVDKDYTKDEDKENEEWEFQDFKGAINTKPNTSATPNTSIPSKIDSKTLKTQILQPVKVDMLMPTLNWPDPGQVRETFDDITEFISKTTNSDNNNDSTKNTTDKISNLPFAAPDTMVTPLPTLQTFLENSTASHSGVNSIAGPKIDPCAGDFLDDDFDTFQSAFPISNSNNHDFLTVTSASTLSQVPINQNIDYGFFNSADHSPISISKEIKRPNEVLRANPSLSVKESAVDNRLDFPSKSLPTQKAEIPMMPSNILQPITVNSNASTQKTGQILQPLSLESYSQINWPNPGIDLQDLSRFNPVDTLQSLKSDLSTGSQSKGASPVHSQKVVPHTPEDDWGEFVSSKPKQPALPNPSLTIADEDEWSDFISSPTIKPQNGLNTISFNVHTNSNLQKPSNGGNKLGRSSETTFDIPTLNYITPKSGSSKSYNIDRHLQRL